MFRALGILIAFASILMLADAASAQKQPAYVLELPESVPNIFVAEAGIATFYRFEQTPAGLTLNDQGYMSIGENGVGKQRAWDRKTPLGIYFVIDELDTSRMHEKYGVAAFPLDYPNAWDRRQDRTGDGIWVHGVLAGGGRRPPLDSDGCLALPNELLLELQDKFAPLITPVIVTRKLEWQEPATLDAQRRELKNAVRQWAAALATSDLHAYLSAYDKGFRYHGMSLGEWSSFQLQTLANRGVVDVAIDELLLLADPEEEGLYLSRFKQTVTDKETSSVTTKRLYWRRDAEGALKIVAEDNG